MTKPNSITVATNLLAAIATWAYTDNSHPKNIHAVAFRADGTIMATDGSRCVVVPHETHGLAFGVARPHLLAAVAAQNALARDGVDPPIDHDLVVSPLGDAELTDGPYGSRTIELRPNGKHVTINIGLIVITVPRVNVDIYPTTDQIFTGNNKGSPDGYLIDARYLTAIETINTATAGYRHGVRVTHWGSIDKAGKRSALVLEGATGVKFAIMPHVDKGGAS